MFNQFFSFKFFRAVGMMPLLTLGLFLLLIWAAFSNIDQTIRTTGQLVSNARTQVIQASDGGVLSELLVTEGQRVHAGQTLAVLESDRAQAGYEETKERVMSLKAALVRLRSELTHSRPLFGFEFNAYPEYKNVQLGYFEQRKKTLNEQLDVLKNSILMAAKEHDTNVTLFASGDIGELEVFRAKRQLLELQAKEQATINQYLQEARQEEIKVRDELSSQTNKLTERLNVLEHTQLTAPVDGVVKLLKVTTIGGVLRPGDELMQISPIDDEIAIEVKISPSDVGQLYMGLPATIKLDAFDYSIYGTLNGKLSYISSDTLTEQTSNGQYMTYYRARIILNQDQLQNPKAKEFTFKLGMTASADIRTGQRSVLNYLLKPIVKNFSGALSER